MSFSSIYLQALSLALPLIFSVAAQAAPLVVLPLGDSMTEGAEVPGAYRPKLWKNFGSSSAVLDFVGSNNKTAPSALLGDWDNEGHSGFAIGHIQSNIASWLGQYASPDYILMMIGTNDVINANPDPADALYTLVSTIRGLRPKSKLIVASITPLVTGTFTDQYHTQIVTAATQSRLTSFNAAIPGIVACLGPQVYFCDMNSKLTASDIAPDLVHLNKAGYDKMGDAWYGAIQDIQAK